jgi:vacuolar-type H+-ATPase subunit E/Vma4
MALADLLKALRAQAAERRSTELAAADAEVAHIAAAAASSLERRRKDFVNAARREEQEVGRRTLARAQSEAAESVLLARDRLLGRVKSALERRVAQAARDPAYLDALPRELRVGLDRLPRGSIVVWVAPEMAERLGQALGEGEEVRVETVPGMGAGFTAVAPDAGVEVDATLELRLEQAWPRLAIAVLRDLAP